MIYSLIVLSSFVCAVFCADIRSIVLNDISYTKLSFFDEPTVLLASRLLSTYGILKISSIPNLNNAQIDAFSSLSQCLASKQNDAGNVFETLLNDGTKRLTFGVKSFGGVSEPVTHECGKSSTSF